MSCLTATLAAAELEIDPEHPYFFRDGDRHVYLLGASDDQALFLWENDKGFDWREYLETLHAHGFNYVRQYVTAWNSVDTPREYPAQFSSPLWVFARPGPGTARDGKPKFNLTRFNGEYFGQRIRPFLACARELGIYVELTLFARTDRGTWPGCLYSDRNNVNELGLQPRQPESDRALQNEPLLAIQEAYVSRVLAETAEFGNVIYEIANETGGHKWVTHFVDFIHNHPEHPSHLVSAGEQMTAYDPVAGPNDIVIKHRGWGRGGGLYATDAHVKTHHDVLLKFRTGKPIIHNEFFLYANQSTDDPNFVRKMMWGDFTAAGHCNFSDFAHFRGTGRTMDEGDPAQPPPREILEGGRHLRSFIDRVPFWQMRPADECVAKPGPQMHAMALAAAGRCYVVYLLGGPVRALRMTVPGGGYIARWYDPKTGRLGEAIPVRARNGELTLSVPGFEQDIVLWMHRPGP
ncbi:MAG: hypothetical protein U9R79_03240 [Armatimonadota bacterium]|nr:hypothetical protein [Armatimonadota bacterium]